MRPKNAAAEIGAEAKLDEKESNSVFDTSRPDGTREQIEAGLAKLTAGKAYTLIREIPVDTPYRHKFRAILADPWLSSNYRHVRVECNDERAFTMDADSSVELIHAAIGIFMNGFYAGHDDAFERRLKAV